MSKIALEAIEVGKLHARCLGFVEYLKVKTRCIRATSKPSTVGIICVRSKFPRSYNVQRIDTGNVISFLKGCVEDCERRSKIPVRVSDWTLIY